MSISMDKARQHIGDAVVYDDGHGTRQDGTIFSVNESYVFVRYGHNDSSIRATNADDLTLLAESL